MSATLISLGHMTSRIIDAEQAQFAADTAALSCVLANQDQPREIAKSFAEQNFGELLQIEIGAGRCVTVVRSRMVVRRAVALSVRGFDLPTLQR